MSAEIVELYKEIGETPLECIGRFRKEHTEYEGQKMSYLGRLDPMAEGLLLVLVGDMRKKEEYLALDKTYEFEVLWGVSTDTYDVLGVVERTDSSFLALNPLSGGSDATRRLESVLSKLRLKKTQSYPPYSSRTVGGTPLWSLSREGRVEDIDVPTRSIRIFDIKHIETRWVEASEVLEDVERRVAKVQGDFRQDEIIKSWNAEFAQIRNSKFLISKFISDVSSGTYVRGLANEMGEKLGVPALAWSIKRTRVGTYRL